MKIRKPSPAMVVACIALFVALSGAGYAAFHLPDNSVKSRHIVNGQVKPVDLAPGVLPAGRFNAGGACNPSVSDVADLTCATITMDFPRSARALLVVGGSWHEQGTLDGSTLGHCFLYADTTLVWSASYGQKTETFVPNGLGSPYSGTVSQTNVTDVLPAGEHTFRVDCRENEADITFVTALSAVRLSAG
jgi:hypothetical protein